MKKAATFLLITLFSITAFSQVYEKQVGLRLGVTSGISGKVISQT